MISKEIVERVKATYHIGMRIRLLRMDDIQASLVGTEGTVLGVDDIGSVIVAWNDGSRLNVVLDEDEIEFVSKGTSK